jgi:hypothetical protein
MTALSELPVRRAFVIFGSLGYCGYLEHLASDFFKGSWLFPNALSAIGLMVIYLVFYNKNTR